MPPERVSSDPTIVSKTSSQNTISITRKKQRQTMWNSVMAVAAAIVMVELSSNLAAKRGSLAKKRRIRRPSTQRW
jgi:hypothetical protein